MLFSSIAFLFYFFPAVFLLYYIFSFSRMLQNILLLLASLLFYAWGEPKYVFLMMGSIVFNSLLGYLVQRGKGKGKKLLLWLAVAVNIGVLFVFKYLGFVVESFGGSGISLPLPIGISFFTFQALSYVVDVYRGTTKAENPFYVGLYISFFPQLIAGPIIQYNTVADQIRNRKTTFDKLALGLSRFTVGLGKKVLLSNCFAAVADHVFQFSQIGTDKMQVPAMLAWLGSIAYTLQIYYDFSGYSDMAIGLGLCFGFKFGENFNYPYIANSVSDFWKRWHISLTDWFREYVYFPLGGSRVKNEDYMVRNMFVVWLLTGIWHGANWTFLFWGLYYFVFQLAERFSHYPDKWKSSFWKHVYTLLVVNTGWVIFRAENLYQAGRYFMNMLGVNRNGFYSETAVMLLRENWVFFVVGIVFSMPIARNMNQIMYQHPESRVNKVYTWLYPPAMVLLFILCVSSLASGTYNPFIYFNFLGDRKMKKYILKKKIFAVVFLALFLGFSARNLMEGYVPIKTFLAEEEFSIAGLEEVITDSLYGRMNFIETYSYMQVLMDKREYNDFTCIEDEEGFLHYASLYQEDNEKLFDYALRVRRMQDYVKQNGTEVIFVIPPGKYVEGVTEFRPGISVNDPNNMVDELFFYLNRLGVETLDLRESMPNEKLSYEETFFRTDHHWTIPAAFYATGELVEKIDESFGENLDPEGYYMNPDNYETVTYKSGMLGSMARKTGANFNPIEDFTALWPRFTGEFYREYTNKDGHKESEEGLLVETLMNTDVLNNEDVYSESLYSLYLDSLKEYEKIVNLEKPEGPKVLMIRDSYFSPVMYFMAPMCGEIHAFWSLASEKMRVEDYIRENKFDYIVVEVYPYNINDEAFNYFKE